jgi:hypothetical protein
VPAALHSTALRMRSDRLARSRDGGMAVCYACQSEVLRHRSTLFDPPWCFSGMPGAASSSAILVKGPTLAAAVASAAHRARQTALLGILLVIVACQLVGTHLESLFSMDLRRLPFKRLTHRTKEQTK